MPMRQPYVTSKHGYEAMKQGSWKIRKRETGWQQEYCQCTHACICILWAMSTDQDSNAYLLFVHLLVAFISCITGRGDFPSHLGL